MKTEWAVRPGEDARCQHPGLRILVVEDCPDCAASSAMLLRLWGHEVEVVRDGQTALEAVKARHPDVVLLDIGLPGDMDGWAVAGQIRQQCGEKPPLIVAVSGFGTEGDRQHSAASGIHLHLTKPVDPETLEAVLRRFQEFVYG
jgi:CheY-like chemotaxis protein